MYLGDINADGAIPPPLTVADPSEGCQQRAPPGAPWVVPLGSMDTNLVSRYGLVARAMSSPVLDIVPWGPVGQYCGDTARPLQFSARRPLSVGAPESEAPL